MRRIAPERFRVFSIAAGLFAILSGLAWGLSLGVHMAGGLPTVCALNPVLGGRVTPAFTRYAAHREGAPDHSPSSVQKTLRGEPAGRGGAAPLYVASDRSLFLTPLRRAKEDRLDFR